MPTAVFAQGFIAPLVPCGALGQPACDACGLTALAQRVINFLVYFAGVMAVLMFAWAGILYATSSANPGHIETAHKIFWNVLIGFVFTLAAWLIVDTIMKELYNTSKAHQQFGPWNEILCRDTSSPADSMAFAPIETAPRAPEPLGYCATETIMETGVNARQCFETEMSCEDWRLQSGISDQCAGVPLARGGVIEDDSYHIPPGSQSSSAMAQAFTNTQTYNDTIRSLAKKYNVSEDEIRAIVVGESGGVATREVGDSVGLMMVRTLTAREVIPELLGANEATIKDWLRVPENNLEAGVKYYAQQRDKFKDLDLATAAYNGGPGANEPSKDCDGLLRWQCPYDSRTVDGKSCWNTGLVGCSPNEGYKETRVYVSNVKQVRDFISTTP